MSRVKTAGFNKLNIKKPSVAQLMQEAEYEETFEKYEPLLQDLNQF